MFEKTTVAPPDPVFGLMESFRQDPRDGKINLTVGAYQTDDGVTPVLRCVKEAESRLLKSESTKNYLPIDGSPPLTREVAKLILGEDHEVVTSDRFATAVTPGGTGALRIAGDLIRQNLQTETIWICDPTWANHPQIFNAARLKIEPYRYLTPDRRALDFEAIVTSLNRAEPGDAVLLHTVCHNPTGFDLNREHWLQVFEILEQRQLLPIFDFAYQGFGESVDADAWPIREYLGRGHEAVICSSFSKNMGLYGERVGAITVAVSDPTARGPVLSQIKSIIRTLYSTPPLHGGAIVETVLRNADLREQWLQELTEMRVRIESVRQQFVGRLQELAPGEDFSFILRQSGMFSFSGLAREQIIRLREENAIYAVESGRINVAGINSRNLEPLCQAVVGVWEAAGAASR